MFERKPRYRHARLKAGRDKTVLRCGVVSASPVPTNKPYLQFLIIFFHHKVSTYFGGHLMHQSTQQQKVRGNSRLRFTGILQADAYGGYNPLFKVDRNPAPLTQALCWAHSRRKFFLLADIASNAKRGKNAAAISPVALEAVKRIDELFDVEREVNGLSANDRLQRRQMDSRPLVDELRTWLRSERTKLSRSSPVTEPIDYMLKRWDGFTAFLGDGRVCLTNNAAERALRGFALGRKSWLFAGSDRGADRAAFMATLIMSAKLNDIDPQVWLADVLARIADTPITRLEDLLPWKWSALAVIGERLPDQGSDRG